ncbi:MAG: hypothetical protein RMJ83_05675 [Armatimonadota bacterium]|nr:hypothetical protein [Armatimonadota bacterium]
MPLELRMTPWEESWLMQDPSASSAFARCWRNKAFRERMHARGVQVHTMRLRKIAGFYAESLPPEFVGALTAPFYARALNSLNPTHNWLIVVQSLMTLPAYWNTLTRMRSVKILELKPPPAEGGVFEVARPTLPRVMPYLWGDATEIFLLPNIAGAAAIACQVFRHEVGVPAVRPFVQELPLLVAIFRDATVMEIVSRYPTEVLREQMRLDAVNRALTRHLQAQEARLDALRRACPQLEQQVFAQADVFWLYKAKALSQERRVATVQGQRMLVNSCLYRRGKYDLLLRYEFANGDSRTVRWLLVRVRPEADGLVQIYRFRRLGSWIS